MTKWQTLHRISGVVTRNGKTVNIDIIQSKKEQKNLSYQSIYGYILSNGWATNLPLITSSAALIINLLNLGFRSLFLALTIAAAFLIIAIEWITNGLTKKSPILKYLFDLSVEAPQYLSPGTLIFPMLSNSVLYFITDSFV